ncbi:hypothetical protein MCOR27_002883 [Pyricularia oryzae]|uniref:Uncharacterized protein n=1 Tax=Pyricularia grisea TaxID=148305 RepID=A0ABQ8N777_PYRGI|nr:hypothetical protein MCOR01_000508 [Pyricularia oryzae]KAI6291026.1 hypothetical protein MCOR33_010890 [Pyricularia grisea]KAI6255647.1 hypothetical protein MCOR19_007849 [Pyricularia oryzae]KAI6264643.1 hypothetical protein MCOR26_011219 [Pyricularia oryzae]KAI6284127.1 hypothetical protein MCOR27_002883 [Pyricularia oryzae]
MRFFAILPLFLAALASAGCYRECMHVARHTDFCRALCNGQLVFNPEAWEQYKKQHGIKD